MIDIPKSALNWMMRPRLFFLIQLLLFVAIFSGAFHVEYKHFMDAMKNAARSNRATGVQLSNLILKHQQAIVGIMRSYGARKSLVKAIQEKDIEAVTGYFVGMRKEMPELDIVFISDARGTLWANHPRNAESIGKNFSYRDWYVNTSRQWKPHISGVYKRVVGTNDLAVAITVPVFDENRRPVGILGASQDTVFIEGVIETSVDDDALKVTLVDQSGNIVYSKKTAERKEVTRYTYPTSGDTITAYTSVKPLMWTIVVEKEKKAILASIFNHLIHTGVTSLALYLFIGLALILIRKYVVFEQAFALLAAEEKIRESEERHRVVIEQTGQLVYDYDVRSGNVVVSGAITHITGYAKDEVLFDKSFWREQIHPDDREAVLNFLLNVTKGNASNYRIRYRFRRKDGSHIHVEDSGVCMNDAGGRTYRILGAIEDVTFQQQAEQSQKLAINILNTLNRSNDLVNIISDILKIFKGYTDIEAIAVRLKEGDDFPYYVQDGLSNAFMESEGNICARDDRGDIVRDAKGNPCLECMCGTVLSGRTDSSLSFFTDGGSFWTNSVSKLSASTTDEVLPGRMRNGCSSEGYESIALIPLRSNGKIIGLLQMNDRRENFFTAGFIRYLEGISSSIGIALSRIQSEEKLKESEARYRSIFDNAVEGIFQTTPDGSFITVNNAFAKMYGYDSPDEMVSSITSISDELYVRPEDRTECMHMLETQNEIKFHEVLTKRKDGPHFWARLNVHAVRDGEERTIYYEGTVENITERKEAEQALVAEMSLSESILESTPGVFYCYDDRLCFQKWNRNFERVTGYTAEELSRISPLDLFEGDDRWFLEERIKEVFKKGESTAEADFVSKDGRKTPYFFTGKRVVIDNTQCLIGMGIDITERKQAEAGQKALIEELKKTIEGTVEALAATSEIRDPYTAGHQRRVTQLACAVAAEMNLAADAIDKIRIASLLHDVGKISIPAEILSKPALLNEYEFSIIKLHTEAGYEILKNIKFPWDIAEIILQHHERLDGSGYPRALRNGDILLEAKIIAAADVVEAMASHRPYRPALGLNAAINEISSNADRLYDRAVVEACVRVLGKKEFGFE